MLEDQALCERGIIGTLFCSFLDVATPMPCRGWLTTHTAWMFYLPVSQTVIFHVMNVRSDVTRLL